MSDMKGAEMRHRALTPNVVRQKGTGSHGSQKAETLEAPTPPATIPLVHQAPAKPPLITYSPPAFPIRINHSSLLFVQTSPQPWAHSAQYCCCSLPHQMGRDGWKKGLHFHLCSGPHAGAWLTGEGGAPTATSLRCYNSATNLGSLGLKGASDTQATNVGLLACSLAAMVAELISHFSVLGAEDEEGWVPYRRMAGAFHPQRQTKAPGILLPLPCPWLEAAISTIPVTLRGSPQAFIPHPAGVAAARDYQFSRGRVCCPPGPSPGV